MPDELGAVGRNATRRLPANRIRTIGGGLFWQGAKTHQQIAGSKLVEIPNCGHFPHIEQPDAFDHALLSFLNQ